MTADDYLQQMQQLLPPGPAWTREQDAVLTRLLAGWAQEFARVDGRANRLQEEADPRTTLEMLADWEQTAGLPDPCVAGRETLQERRGALVQKLTWGGGQSRTWFIGLGALLGFAVTIDEFRPFICGSSRCGDRLNGGAECRHWWRVNVAEAKVVWFRAGASQCGESLGEIDRAEALECMIRRLRPAHTEVVFNYSGV